MTNPRAEVWSENDGNHKRCWVAPKFEIDNVIPIAIALAIAIATVSVIAIAIAIAIVKVIGTAIDLAIDIASPTGSTVRVSILGNGLSATQTPLAGWIPLLLCGLAGLSFFLFRYIYGDMEWFVAMGQQNI